ncbi:EAL and HDOD domain-containing protein [Pelosinus sp. UFO1]|uniref:EAL and HDOD domain-containing protein n=1 Tax=Pelosinus sp. UFO1 TaxID=484770 RepID=UPI0004D19051|nr:HDOD domain-containing protein [Pelosinus sp. UFO1]AIF49621.1 diguanylate phosphodiesterase metal dependent hydrolase domain containing protein [Pelosinus sp. UFO1]
MDVFVARQPIFTKSQKIFGYELLFRNSLDNAYNCKDGDQATSDVICNSFFAIGMDNLTGGKRAFINFTENLLIKEIPMLLPKELVVVEILENVEPTIELIEACKKLKEAGYLLALDDFVFQPKFVPLLNLADIIKIDFLSTTGHDRKRVIQDVGDRSIKFLAEKVETRADFEQALKLGYAYFQGYFFSKPIVLKGKDIPTNKVNQLRVIRVLRELEKENFKFGAIEQFIMYDVTLSYQLLRFINSVAFSLANEISSVKHALVLLGKNEIFKWVSLIVMRTVGDNKTDGILVTSLTRAKFCELIAEKAGLKEREPELFMMGMFSLIDVFIRRPLKAILAELPISEDVKGALLGETNKLSQVYRLTLSYERAEWTDFTMYAANLGIKEEDIPDYYKKAVAWADEICRL